MSFEVIYSAAHAEFQDAEPLGGGKAVADYLIREWGAATPFALTVLSPRALGMLDKTHPRPSREGTGAGLFCLQKQLAQMTELEYARFCRQFERAATAEILRRDPRECVVLSNDISEGPNFAALGERGYRIVTIFHVDVVEYFTKFYLRNIVRPERLTKFRRFSLLPDVLRLVFQKQYECVRHSTRLVVPSVPMRDTILRCYPWCQPQRIVVLPWGDVSQRVTAGRDACATRQFQISDDEFVILTLSRLSPEKGIERLLVALRDIRPNERKVRVFICGAPAYMKGQRYAQKLRRLATKLTNIQVEFPGHVTGAEKAALLQRADLFVSPSRHESYGLTIAEAEAVGCRVLSYAHYGARGHVVDCGNRRAFAQALAEEIIMGRTRRSASLQKPSSSDTAQCMAQLLVEVASAPIP